MGTNEHATVTAGREPRGISTLQFDPYALGFQEIGRTQAAVVGGKGAYLGELSHIEGIRVPPGFCVTTTAFRQIMGQAPSISDLLDRLSRLHPGDRDAIRTLSEEVRRTLEAIVIPDDVAAAINPRARPPGRARRLRRPIERHGRGLADGLLRGSARHVPRTSPDRPRSSST